METLSEGKIHPVLADMAQILSTLDNEDALQIFSATKDGIRNSTYAIKDLGLTKKKYYTRLKQLQDSGLIEKIRGIYRHTIFGSACYRLGEVFSKILSNRDHFDMLTRLKNVDAFSSAEKRKVTEALSIDETFGLSNLLSPVLMIDDYESLVREAVGLIDRAESEVYLATQYFDMQVVEANLRGIKRGVKFSFLYKIVDSTYDRLRMMMSMAFSSPRIFKFFYEWLRSDDLSIRLVDLPYTFLIVDRKHGLVELKKPYEDAFSLAFIFESRILCSKLIETFNSLWDRGSKADSIMDSLEKKEKSIHATSNLNR